MKYNLLECSRNEMQQTNFTSQESLYIYFSRIFFPAAYFSYFSHTEETTISFRSCTFICAFITALDQLSV